MIAGIAIGLLIGIITGMVALVLLRTARTAAIKDTNNRITLVTQILAISTFWFGGPWVATSLLKLLDLSEIITPYIVTVAFVFMIIIAYPLCRWILQLGKELGGSNDGNP